MIGRCCWVAYIYGFTQNGTDTQVTEQLSTAERNIIGSYDAMKKVSLKILSLEI